MLLKPKVTLIEYLIVAFICTCLGYTVDKIFQFTVHTLSGSPYIIHPWPYNIYFYLVLGLSLILCSKGE